MSASADRVLDLIDAGLQSSGEASYGTDRFPDRCARCQANEPSKDGDLCAGCRTYLLGDSEDDPADAFPRGDHLDFSIIDEVAWFPVPQATTDAIRQAATDMVREVGATFNEAALALTQAFNAMSPERLDAMRSQLDAMSEPFGVDPLTLRAVGGGAMAPARPDQRRHLHEVRPMSPRLSSETTT